MPGILPLQARPASVKDRRETRYKAPDWLAARSRLAGILNRLDLL